MSQITKKQHYVPQFLLRGFDATPDGSEKINVYDINRNSNRGLQSINTAFMQNYFYDKDNEVENFLSSKIEAPASVVINEIRCGQVTKIQDKDTSLIKFIACQHSRTVEARDDALAFINAHFSEIFSDLNRLNNLGFKDPTKIKLALKDKDAMRNFISERVYSGVLMSKGLEDLKFHLLVNKTNSEFVISDHPITQYNWLYRELEHPGIGSLMAKGVQFYLPISPTLCLCAYDPMSYKFGTRKSFVSDITCISDIDWLNDLQVRSTNSVIGYCSTFMQQYIARKSSLIGQKIYTRHSEDLGEITDSGGNLRTRHMAYTKQVRLTTKPSFYKVLKRANSRSTIYEERDPEVSSAVLELQKFAREQRRANEL
ncbi:DUF4238 domain-containing protein [Vibrio penaeicida]|uniref:DUF4238 domain-containing protein n=1 Tax=Vibrio penaeicida TaxID=104609 RepID=UPI000CE9FD45|nr:DUF4238 domain-containing protein [Vibrio penaeicida]